MPKSRSTSVKVVAASSSENSAPVIAMASCNSPRMTSPRSRPADDTGKEQSEGAHGGGFDRVEITGGDAAEQQQKRGKRETGEQALRERQAFALARPVTSAPAEPGERKTKTRKIPAGTSAA